MPCTRPWCQAPGPGARHQGPSALAPGPGARHRGPSALVLGPSTWHQAPGPRALAPGPGARHHGTRALVLGPANQTTTNTPIKTSEWMYRPFPNITCPCSLNMILADFRFGLSWLYLLPIFHQSFELQLKDPALMRGRLTTRRLTWPLAIAVWPPHNKDQ